MCTLGSARVISNTVPYQNTRCKTSVAVHNAAIQHPLSTVYPDSNSTDVADRCVTRQCTNTASVVGGNDDKRTLVSFAVAFMKELYLNGFKSLIFADAPYKHKMHVTPALNILFESSLTFLNNSADL
ncbi:hypothetical protein TNCV_952071 [Trichonephila clavipes]|nr:hypothetical protein TNCV_952071 [Trichonephila clavipes]